MFWRCIQIRRCAKHYQGKKKFNCIAIACTVIIFLLSYSFVLQPYSESTESDYGVGELVGTES